MRIPPPVRSLLFALALTTSAKAGLEISPKVVTDWGQGAQCSIAVRNASGEQAPERWGIEVQIEGRIQSLWGARIIKEKAGAYLLAPEEWAARLTPGSTADIGFIVSPGGLSPGSWRAQIVAARPAEISHPPRVAPAGPSPASPTASPTPQPVTSATTAAEAAKPEPQAPSEATTPAAPTPSPVAPVGGSQAPPAASQDPAPAPTPPAPTPAPTPSATPSATAAPLVVRTPQPALTFAKVAPWPVRPTSENLRMFGRE